MLMDGFTQSRIQLDQLEGQSRLLPFFCYELLKLRRITQIRKLFVLEQLLAVTKTLVKGLAQIKQRFCLPPCLSIGLGQQVIQRRDLVRGSRLSNPRSW